MSPEESLKHGRSVVSSTILGSSLTASRHPAEAFCFLEPSPGLGMALPFLAQSPGQVAKPTNGSLQADFEVLVGGR